jgi:hypothetical protein
MAAMSRGALLLWPLILSLPGCDIGRLRLPTVDVCADGACRRPCEDLTAAQLIWSVTGFSASDILLPDVRDQPGGLTAILHVGNARVLTVRGSSWQTSQDCSAKTRSVQWQNSNPDVLQVVPSDDGRAATFVALQPGDVVVRVQATFLDGSPPLELRMFSFTQVSSGNVSVIRVVP